LCTLKRKEGVILKEYITEEQYNNALKTKEEIDRQELELKNNSQNKVYNAHIDLPGSFAEVIIDLQRRNNEIDQIIKKLKNKYLEEHEYSEQAAQMLEQAIFLIEHQLQNNETQKDSRLFHPILANIREQLSRKQGHTFLLNEIVGLEKERDEARRIISQYEKQKSKFSFFKR